VLNKRFCTAEESYICDEDVLRWQKHLTEDDLAAAHNLLKSE
jgi:hypothetical protein